MTDQAQTSGYYTNLGPCAQDALDRAGVRHAVEIVSCDTSCSSVGACICGKAAEHRAAAIVMASHGEQATYITRALIMLFINQVVFSVSE